MIGKWKLYWVSPLFVVALAGCSLAGNLSQPVATPSPSISSPSLFSSPAGVSSEAATNTPAPTVPPATDTPGPTAAPAAPSDAVIVNTFVQEVYPFGQAGNCSLGAAIQSVLTQQAVDQCHLPPGSSTVYLPAGTYTLTEADNAPAVLFGKLAQPNREGLPPAGLPLVASQLTILGNGSTIQRTGPVKFGIFQVFVGGNLTLRDLTITGGDVSDEHDGNGGALSIYGGSVTLDHVTLTGNEAVTGGAIENHPGGAGQAVGLTLVDTVVTKNLSLSTGGGIDNNLASVTIRNSQISYNVSKDPDFGGGGIYNDGGQVTLDDSQLVGNLAREGAGLYNENGIANISNQSVVSGNVATEFHAFIPHGGGGVNNIGDLVGSVDTPAEVTIQDSFVIGNQAAGSTDGGIYNQAKLTVTDSVLANNIAGAGGGLFNDSQGVGSLTGSCILQNQAVSVTPKGFGNGVENDNDLAFDASGNWWGIAAGPGNSVTRGVHTASILNAAPGICAASLPTPFPTPTNP